MNIRTCLTSLFAMLLLALPASASTTTFNFNEFANPDLPGGAAAAPGGGVTFYNANHGVYDTFIPTILLGDDGWSEFIRFSAADGYSFDALSLRILNGFQDVWMARVNSAVDANDPYAQLSHALSTDALTQMIYANVQFRGYRDGAQVAYREETYEGGGQVELSFGASFEDIDLFEVSLDFKGASYDGPEIVGDYLLHCPSGRCGQIEFDDLALSITPPAAGAPALVPLPGAGVLLGLGVLGFGLVSRSKKREHSFRRAT